MWKVNDYNSNFKAVVSDENDQQNSFFVISSDSMVCKLVANDISNFMNNGKRSRRLRIIENINNEYFVLDKCKVGIMCPPKDASFNAPNPSKFVFGKTFYKRVKGVR